MSRNTDYKMLQIPLEAHSVLKRYCSENDYKMGKFVGKLIVRELGKLKPDGKMLPTGNWCN